MTAQGGALRSAGLRAPPQNRRATFLMCYGVQFTNRTSDRYAFAHIFDRVCDEHKRKFSKSPLTRSLH